MPGDTSVNVVGVYEFDLNSTGTLTIQAATEIAWVDDPKLPLPSLPGRAQEWVFSETDRPSDPSAPATPHRHWGTAADGTEIIDPADYLVTTHALTSNSSFEANPPAESLGVEWNQELCDGKHHHVFYRALAESRFQQFFPVKVCQMAPLPGPYTAQQIHLLCQIDTSLRPKAGQSAQSALFGWERMEIPATVRPASPVIREATTVYNWSPPHTKERAWKHGRRTWSFESTRTVGCRLWLERPWFSSGANEMLAVLCWMRTRIAKRLVDRYLAVVSRWAKDPIQEHNVKDSLGLLTRADVLSAKSLKPADVPVLESGMITDTSELARELLVGVAPHQPKFHPREQLWFCDVFLKPNPKCYTPFVWLSVARYQPYALPGLALSRPLRLENPVQLWPPRTLRIELNARMGLLIAEIDLAGGPFQLDWRRRHSKSERKAPSHLHRRAISQRR